MNLRWSSRGTQAMGLALVIAAAACNNQESAGTADATLVPVGPQAEAAALGQEIYDLIDRAMSYRTSHRDRSPRSLRELGIDELTPITSRSLEVVDGRPEISVRFRETKGRTVLGCTGGSSILEEATIEGRYTLTCENASGDRSTFAVTN